MFSNQSSVFEKLMVKVNPSSFSSTALISQHELLEALTKKAFASNMRYNFAWTIQHTAHLELVLHVPFLELELMLPGSKPLLPGSECLHLGSEPLLCSCHCCLSSHQLSLLHSAPPSTS
jgi:hypothetical protein